MKEAGKVEQYRQILDAQKEMLEMQNTISNYGKRIKELEEELKIKGQIRFENDAYWLFGDDNKKEGPFCSVCYDNNAKLIRLYPWSGKIFECKVCKNHFGDSNSSVVLQDDGYQFNLYN